MTPLTILMLGGAKRVSMGRKLIAAGEKLGFGVKLLSYELSNLVAISCVAEVIIGLRWSDPGVVQHIADLCRSRCIDIVIPFVDGAIAIAAEVEKQCAAEGLKVFAPTASTAIADRTFNKLEADRFYRRFGIPVPESFSIDRLTDPSIYPIIAKPALGSASKGIVVAHSPGELPPAGLRANYIFQRYLEGYEEYSVDCYVSRNGEILAAVPRRRLEVSGGEVITTEIVSNPQIEYYAIKALCDLELYGASTLQFLVGNGECLLMEINARVGGGAVCSAAAGASIPLLIIGEWAGLPLARQVAVGGTVVARYLAETVVSKGNRI